MIYILDTNIFLSMVRRPKFMDYIYDEFGKPDDVFVTSVVVEGELKSFVRQRKWGVRKIRDLNYLLSKAAIYPIKTQQIVERYADIDTFSQGKHETMQLGMSARSMGKNDLWIAATASNATLLTIDKDFNHLNGVFFEVNLMDLNKII